MSLPKRGPEIEGEQARGAAPLKEKGAGGVNPPAPFDFVLLARLGAVLIVILAAIGLYFSARP
jgi:hypothetical protein